MSEADEGCGIDGSQINGPSRWVEKETSEREEIEDAPHNEVFCLIVAASLPILFLQLC
jgi:hypothetical protein